MPALGSISSTFHSRALRYTLHDAWGGRSSSRFHNSILRAGLEAVDKEVDGGRGIGGGEGKGGQEGVEGFY